MTYLAKSETFLFGVIFLGIWGIFVVIDYSLVGMRFPYLIEDNETGWFSSGLKWLTFDPRLWSHHPSPSFEQISGLITSFLSLFVNFDGTYKSIRYFNTTLTILQGITVFVAGSWFAWASTFVGLRRWYQAVLIFLVFSYPTLIYLSGHWTYSYVVGLLGLPLGLTLFGVLQGYKKALPIGGFCFGMFAANFYPSLPLLLLFIFSVVLQNHFSPVRSLTRVDKSSRTLR